MLNSTTTNSTLLPISIFIITLNEAQHLGAVLASCRDFAEVIIVDSGSQDDTLTIAQQFGATIYHQDFLGYAAQKDYARSLCRYEWVFNLDGDEVLTPGIVAYCREFIRHPTADALSFARREFFLNRPLSPFTHRQQKCRLFRKNQAAYDLTNLVHETIQVTGTEQAVSLAFDHYGNNHIAIIASKNNRYAQQKAAEKFHKGRQAHRLKLISIFPWTFFKSYCLRRYLFSGMRGFILAVLEAYYAFLKEAELYERQQTHHTTHHPQ